MEKAQLEPNVESEKPLSGKKAKVYLDTILVEELGQFGLYQLRMMLFAVVVVLFSAWATVDHIFTTARISTR